jgi:hypothetical protein
MKDSERAAKEIGKVKVENHKQKQNVSDLIIKRTVTI